MNRSQQKFGEPKEIVKKKVQSFMSDMVQEFIAASPFAVLATANAEGECDASPKGGQPGFVKALDERRLVLPDVAGNNLFQSYENIESNPHAGLFFTIPGCDWTVRVNGRARVVEKDEGALAGKAPEVLWSDDNTKIQQGLLVEVDEAYAHCPRAFLFSKLWNTETITTAQDENANRYWMERWRKSMEARD